MAILRKSQLVNGEYYQTSVPEDCECFTCGKPIWKTDNADETCVFWQNGEHIIFLHNTCAQKLALNLIWDSKIAETFNQTGKPLRGNQVDATRKGK
jgi:hypothetical protein